MDGVGPRKQRAPLRNECLRLEATRRENFRCRTLRQHPGSPCSITCGTNLCASNNAPATAANASLTHTTRIVTDVRDDSDHHR